MKISFICTFPPRKCGIATFTNNLVNAVSANSKTKESSDNPVIIALNDQDQTYIYPDPVKFIIKENDENDYINAAEFINFNESEVCILEHEFGIFGGESGVYILLLVKRLQIPLIVTFHTVLKEPTFMQKVITQEICKKAYKVIVMSSRAVDFLVSVYNVPIEKIKIIEHGVPEEKNLRPEFIRKKFNLDGKKTLFTFGLISRNKGIETVIKALPEVVKKHNDLSYIVLGNTHPSVYRANGEEYREYLFRLVKERKLQKNVFFYKTFVSDTNLMEFLTTVDIYITPYLTEAQITSGTLSYAIGAGAAIISTPYWHAQELLADGRGILFDFNDHRQLSEIIIDLLENKEKLKQLKKSAFEYGKKLNWNKIGLQYLEVSKEAKKNYVFIEPERSTIIDPTALPSFTLEHILRLTDDTGIVQHANFGIPNLKEGYCLDDNARALLMSLMTYNLRKDKCASKLMPVYLSYIIFMQNDNGTFKNLLSFNRMYLDEAGTEDSFGRTIWALGYLINNSPNDSYHQIGFQIFQKSVNHFDKLKDIRGIANTIIGISYYLRNKTTDLYIKTKLQNLTAKLIRKYEQHKEFNWKWFEDSLTYDNGIIPMSLFLASDILKDKNILEVAIESAGFLEDVSMKDGYLRTIGNNGWYTKDKHCNKFAQQSVDVAAMVMMFYEAYFATGNKDYLNKMFKSYMWYLGENDLHVPVYDFETGGCNDGLEEYGINRNQGAESILSYLLSHLTILDALKIEFVYEDLC